MRLLTRLIGMFHRQPKDVWYGTVNAISGTIGGDISSGRLTDDEYAIQCYNDICDALHILSFDVDQYVEYGRFIGAEIWNAASDCSNLISHQPYGDLIPQITESMIQQLFQDVLSHPTPWQIEDFASGDFWTTIRQRARLLIVGLGIEDRQFGGFRS